MMNVISRLTTRGRLARAGFMMVSLGVWICSHSAAQAVATKATLLMTDGKQQNGFIQDSNAKQILFAVNAQSKGAAISRSSVKSIRFREEANLMKRGRQAFRQSAYEAAAKIFGKVAVDYAGIASLKDNFASEASFFQMECLRRLGKYEELAPILESKAGKAIASTQDKSFGEQLKLMKMWAAYAAGQWDMVKAGMKFYQVPQVGDATMLPAPVFKKMAKPIMIQLSFIRGKLYEQEKKLPLALEDYYRAFTITYGNQPVLAKQAMLAALAIQAADPKLKDVQANIWRLQGLAYYYKNGVGGGNIPAEYEQYAVLPDIPVAKPAEVKKEEKEKKESEDAAKASQAVADKKAADEKKALEGKGEKKVEDKKPEEKK